MHELNLYYFLILMQEHNENANRQRINDLNSMSRSTLYGHFSSFDQYANMRLDVDNMSYEVIRSIVVDE